MTNVVRRSVRKGKRIRYDRAVIPPGSDWFACSNSCGVPSGARPAAKSASAASEKYALALAVNSP